MISLRPLVNSRPLSRNSVRTWLTGVFSIGPCLPLRRSRRALHAGRKLYRAARQLRYVAVEGLPTLAASLISELEGRQRGLLNEWARAFASVQGDAAEWSSSLSGDVERLKGEVATQETTLTEQLSRIEAALRDYGEQFTKLKRSQLRTC